MVYPAKSVTPRRDLAELLEVSADVLDSTKALPSIEALDQIVRKGNYHCMIDHCNDNFDSAYLLRDHCAEKHNYLEADWAADIPSDLNYNERLACALEWDSNSDGDLNGRMKRPHESAWIFQEILDLTEKASRSVVNFQDLLDDAQWSWMTELERAKRKILDDYQLPPALPKQKPTHSNYLVRIFEAKKFKSYCSVSRQTPLMLEQIDEFLLNLAAHQERDIFVESEVAQNSRSKSSSFQHKINEHRKSEGLALQISGPAAIDTMNDNDEGIDMKHQNSRKQSKARRRRKKIHQTNSGTNVDQDGNAEDDLTSRAGKASGNSPEEVLGRAYTIRSGHDLSEKRDSSEMSSDHDGCRPIKSWNHDEIPPRAMGSGDHSPTSEGGKHGELPERLESNGGQRTFHRRQGPEYSGSTSSRTDDESAGIRHIHDRGHLTLRSDEAMGVNKERRIIVHPQQRRSRRRELSIDPEKFTNGQNPIARSNRRRRSRNISMNTGAPRETLVADSLRLPAPDVRPSSTSSQIIKGKGSAAEKGMRTLLIYRAVLFAALCALAADTSCVYETELGRRVVQVL